MLSLAVCAGFVVVGSCAPAACSSTNDVIGYNRQPPSGGASGDTSDAGGLDGSVPAAGAGGDAAGAPSVERSYPNPFQDLLGKTPAQISSKLEAAYQQLFHGDPATEAIFVQVDATQAYVWDPRQNEIRADGFTGALLVSVELDHQTEFDQLWTWADAHVPKTGPLRDYFPWRCTLDGTTCSDEIQPESHFAAATALWLADGRWGSAGAIDYAAAAARLTEASFRTEAGASTSLGELVGLVDAARLLPRSTPYRADVALTTTGAMRPAYFDLWAEKTGDPRAHRLANNARAFLALVADPNTGLLPEQASPDGVIAAGDDVFAADSYPTLVALALDSVWFQKPPFEVSEANRMLGFFHAQPSPGNYAPKYTLSGTASGALASGLSLVGPLGALATPASVSYRDTFVQAVWDAALDTGTSRKFGNTLYLLSALILGGDFRVY